MHRMLGGIEGLARGRWAASAAMTRRLAAPARFMLALAAALILARAAFPGGLSPFAPALFAAGVVAGRQVAALLIGCVLGALNGPMADIRLSLPIGCAIILGGELAWGAAEPWIIRLRKAMRRAPAIQARSPNDAARAAALAGIAVLGPGLVQAGGQPWPSARATGAALLAVACAPLMLATLSLTPRRRFLPSEARAGLWLLCALLAAGLRAIWPPAGLWLAMVALISAPGMGAGLGAAMGGAMLLVSGDARVAAVLALGGASARLFRDRSPALRGIAACGAALLAAGYAGLDIAALGGLLAALPGALLLPEQARSKAAAWLGGGDAPWDPDRLAGLLNRRSARRLRAMAAAFGELAEGYLTPEDAPDEQALLNGLRRAQCEGCTGFDDCWAGESNRGARVLCDLVGLAVTWSEAEREGPLFEAEVPSDIARRCRRSRMIPDRLGGPLEDFARARRAARRRGGENRMISAQFLQAQRLLAGMAQAQAQPSRLRDGQAERAAAALERAGISLSEALTLNGRRELALTLREGAWTRPLAARAAGALGRAWAVNAGIGEPSLILARRPPLAARTGIASMPREAGAPSGDSHLAVALEDDRLLAVICDGMGSGEAAARESAAAVRLLGRFMAAGADWPLAVDTVNALLLNTAGEEMFSTLDMLLLNLATGTAEFVKLAACPALIARDGAVERVEGGRLPLGILDTVRPAAARVRLERGDVVLLASDGVMDAADPAALEALLADPGEDMNALAERVLALAADAAPPDRRDDMTALCVKLVSGATPGADRERE